MFKVGLPCFLIATVTAISVFTPHVLRADVSSTPSAALPVPSAAVAAVTPARLTRMLRQRSLRTQ